MRGERKTASPTAHSVQFARTGHRIGQMGDGLRHVPTVARRADASSLARQRDDTPRPQPVRSAWPNPRQSMPHSRQPGGVG